MKIRDIPTRVHFVGVGGIGMSALAQYLHNKGYVVSGSDRASNDRTKALAKMGIRIYIGHNKYNLEGAKLVVHTSAVHRDNVEIDEAEKLGIRVVLREELLGAIFNSFKTRIAVCGTHGKTTVTAMIHNLLRYNGISHAAFIGGLYQGNNFYFGQDIVVAEACEYNRSFFNLNPTITVCTNAEYDHPDCYRNERAVRNAFKKFICNTDKNGVVVLPKNLAKLADNRKCIYFDEALQGEVDFNQGKPCFTVAFNKRQQQIQLSIVGRHNAYNALAALAVGEALNIPLSNGAAAISDFKGVERRWTEIDKGFTLVCDYAHHPTELACSVATARSVTGGRVICVFQPHTYSRTKAFFNEFALCFKQADVVAYLPIYSAREKPALGVTSQRLAKRAEKLGVNAKYFVDFDAAAKWLKQFAQRDDIVLLLGAGDINNLAKLL